MSKMTIGECKKAAFRLLNQYSIAGTEVNLSYNGQSDDMLRMVDLINDAQMAIATTNKPIEEKLVFSVQSNPNDPISEVEFEMPEDFLFPISISYRDPTGYRRITKGANSFTWIGDDILLLPNKPSGNYTLIYARYPERYPQNVSDNTELDNTPDTHVIIPYYVAAMIAHDQNSKQYYYLYNIWETGLARLNIRPAYATITEVEDVYDLTGYRGVN